jgi:hypothetical protein
VFDAMLETVGPQGELTMGLDDSRSRGSARRRRSRSAIRCSGLATRIAKRKSSDVGDHDAERGLAQSHRAFVWLTSGPNAPWLFGKGIRYTLYRPVVKLLSVVQRQRL